VTTNGERVLIIEDCREGGIAAGQTGTYEGRFDFDTGQPDEFFGNPRIRLQDGSVIWGCQCWWRSVREAGPLPAEQVALEKHKVILREIIAMIEEAS